MCRNTLLLSGDRCHTGV